MLLGGWVAARIGKLGAEAVLLALLIVLAITPFALTYHAASANCEAKHENADLHEQLDTLHRLAELNQTGAQIAGDYVLRRGGTEIIFQTLQRDVPHVIDHYVSVPGNQPQPIPYCVFNRGFVGLWNAANEARPFKLPDAPSRAAGGTAGTYPSEAPGDPSERR